MTEFRWTEVYFNWGANHNLLPKLGSVGSAITLMNIIADLGNLAGPTHGLERGIQVIELRGPPN